MTRGRQLEKGWRPPFSPMAKKDGKDATVWMRAIAPHTYEGHKKDVGDIYLAHEDMVETIVQVLKFAVLDVPPPKAVRPTS